MGIRCFILVQIGTQTEKQNRYAKTSTGKSLDSFYQNINYWFIYFKQFKALF